jgi:hypothetical protein
MCTDLIVVRFDTTGGYGMAKKFEVKVTSHRKRLGTIRETIQSQAGGGERTQIIGIGCYACKSCKNTVEFVRHTKGSVSG